MKLQVFISALILQAFSIPINVYAYSGQDLAIIHDFAKLHLKNIPSSFHFQTRSYSMPITFSSDTAYANVINKWQNKLNQGYEKLFKALFDDLGLQPQQVAALVNDPSIIQQHYLYDESSILVNMMDGWLTSEHIQTDIVKFIESQLKKYVNSSNVRLLFTDSLNGLIKVYGCQKYGYTLCFNLSLYNNKYIKEYYSSMRKQPSSYHVKYVGDGLGIVSNALLVQSGLIQASGCMSNNVQHLEYVLFNYQVNEQMISSQTLTLLAKLKYFQLLLESIFQVYNPLELAIFYMKSDWFDQETKGLWQVLIKDLLAVYDQKTLQKYFAFVRSIEDEVLAS